MIQDLSKTEENVINFLRNQKYNMSIMMTGGGIVFPTMFLPLGGFSDRLYEINIPYDNRALNKQLEENISKCYSADVALKMAKKAYENNPNNTSDDINTVGIGITCSLMRHENEREGRINGVYICFYSKDTKQEYHFDYTQKKDSRSSQEVLVGATVLSLLLDYLGYED